VEAKLEPGYNERKGKYQERKRKAKIDKEGGWGSEQMGAMQM
jgi:hypothetical protein